RPGLRLGRSHRPARCPSAPLPPKGCGHRLPSRRGVGAAASDKQIRIWPLPVPATDDVERLRVRFQVWAGMEVSGVVDCQTLDSETWLRPGSISAGRLSEWGWTVRGGCVCARGIIPGTVYKVMYGRGHVGRVAWPHPWPQC